MFVDCAVGLSSNVRWLCRSGFGPEGLIERNSLELLRAAMEGRVNDVSDLLIHDLVHVDVADLCGHTALLGAAVSAIIWHLALYQRLYNYFRAFLHYAVVHDCYTRVFCATSTVLQVNWHEDVINCLLDNGADVNKLNDEGVSPLAACHVFFYTPDRE